MREMPGGWVLIVEDDGVLARSTARVLASEGLRNVRIAADGRQAAARVRRPGMVGALVDVRLPDANGIDVAVSMHALQPQTEIVIWSGQGDMELVRGANAAGFEFITKGAGTEILRQRARRWAALLAQVTPKTLTIDERFIEVRRRHELTDQQAEALMLALEQRSYREIAIALGVTKKAIEALSRRVAQRTGRTLAQWTQLVRADLHALDRGARDGRSTGVRRRDDSGRSVVRRRASM